MISLTWCHHFKIFIVKKNINIFFFSTIFFSSIVKGQTCDTVPYQHIFYNQGFNTTRIKSFAFTTYSDIYMLGFVTQDTVNNNTDAWIMRTTFHGTPLWSKAIGTDAVETINNIRTMRDGGYIFAGSTRYNSLYETGWIAKIDSTGQPLWSLALRSMNGSISQVIELDNGDVVAVGTLYLNFNGDGKGNVISVSNSSNFIIRLNKDGNLIWQRSFFHAERETLNKVAQLSDENLIVTGNNLNNDSAYIIKINQYDGSVLWMNAYENIDYYNYARIIENPDGSLRFKTGNRVYNFTSAGNYTNGSTEIDLESYGKPIKKAQLEDFGFVNGIEIFYASTKPNPVLFGVKDDSVIEWAHIYPNDVSNDLSLGGGRVYQNNIYLSGSYKSGNSSDTNGNMAYLLKATISGETFCSKDFDIKIKTSAIPAATNLSYSWKDGGAVTPEFIPLYSKNIMPLRILDCTQQTCCNDVSITHTAELCDNNSYTLPDSSIVTKPGFYTSRMNTHTGCDSIIYTNLSASKKIPLLLPADTCMINNMPVTFNLPVDSTTTYHWQDGNTSTNYTINFPGKYWVTAVTHCEVIKDSVDVLTSCEPNVFMPSAFTPNNDGLNDVFRIPQINGQHVLSFSIYNRFGQIIFHSENNGEGWDGTINNKPQSAGTYIYIIKYSDVLGKLHSLKGTVVLIR